MPLREEAAMTYGLKLGRMLTRKKLLGGLVCCVVSGLMGTQGLAAEGLFKYKDKVVSRQELSVPDQQKLGDLELDYHSRLSALVQEAALNLHLDSLAKKLGKTRSEVETTVLAATAPTEEEIKTWYEQNKERIPPDYSFDKVKGDIRNLLQQEKTDRKKQEVIDGLKKSGEIQVLLKDPEVPTFTIDIAGRPVKGDEKAPLTLVEFADYQCPHCKMAGESIGKVLKKYSRKVKLVFMNFPVNSSGISRLVAIGAVCAEKQNKYWEFHEMAFSKQRELSAQSSENFARDLGLKLDVFKTCIGSPEAQARVTKDQEEGQKVGVTGTPTLYLNGKKLRSYEEGELGQAIEKALGAKPS